MSRAMTPMENYRTRARAACMRSIADMAMSRPKDVRLQLGRAGIRLAFVLNQALGAPR